MTTPVREKPVGATACMHNALVLRNQCLFPYVTTARYRRASPETARRV